MSKHCISSILGISCLSIVISLALFSLPAPGYGQTGNASCLMCHSASSLLKTTDDVQVPLYVDPQALATSVHGDQACVDCHVDLRNQPLAHKPDVDPAQCTSCHDAHPNTIHRNLEPSADAPKCQDCHGSHHIRPVEDSASPVYPANSERVCLQCHTDAKTIAPYKQSVHGEAATRSGLSNAGCTDCHSAHKGHDVTDPTSCASCHSSAHEDFSTSAHGYAWHQGSGAAPTCATCHGGHDIQRASDPRSRTALHQISGMCSSCHEDYELMDSHGLPADRYQTYRYSYHGTMLQHGNERVATCVSCHRAHGVLSSSNPESSTHANNLVDTCGDCHQLANLNWTGSKMHVNISEDNKDVLYFVNYGFKWLTLGVMTALVGHIMLDLFAQVRGWRRRSGRRRDE